MSKFQDLPQFDPSKTITVIRPISYAGKEFAPGDEFPVDDPRRARQLYEQRYLRMSDNRDKVVYHKPGGRRVVMRSPGWYDVLDADGVVLTPRAVRKKAADAMAEGAAL